MWNADENGCGSQYKYLAFPPLRHVLFCIHMTTDYFPSGSAACYCTICRHACSAHRLSSLPCGRQLALQPNTPTAVQVTLRDDLPDLLLLRQSKSFETCFCCLTLGTTLPIPETALCVVFSVQVGVIPHVSAKQLGVFKLKAAVAGKPKLSRTEVRIDFPCPKNTAKAHIPSPGRGSQLCLQLFSGSLTCGLGR